MILIRFPYNGLSNIIRQSASFVRQDNENHLRRIFLKHLFFGGVATGLINCWKCDVVTLEMLWEEIKKHMDTSVRDLANLAVNYRKQKFLLHLFAIKLSTLSKSYRKCVICVLLSIDYMERERDTCVWASRDFFMGWQWDKFKFNYNLIISHLLWDTDF